MPYLVGALEALFYLYWAPVYVALAAEGGGGFRFGAGAAAFVRRRARKRAQAALCGGAGSGGAARPRAVWAVLRRLRFDRVELSGVVSLGDAALTAVGCGLLNGAVCGLKGRADAVRAAVRPDFSNDFHIELRGMLRARAGKIIAAALQRGGRENE